MDVNEPVGPLLVCRLRKLLPVVCNPDTASFWRLWLWQRDILPACVGTVSTVVWAASGRLRVCSLAVSVGLFFASVYLALLFRGNQRRRLQRLKGIRAVWKGASVVPSFPLIIFFSGQNFGERAPPPPMHP